MESDEERWERLGRLKPEEKVNLAVGMSDVYVRACADGVRDQILRISGEEPIKRVKKKI